MIEKSKEIELLTYFDNHKPLKDLKLEDLGIDLANVSDFVLGIEKINSAILEIVEDIEIINTFTRNRNLRQKGYFAYLKNKLNVNAAIETIKSEILKNNNEIKSKHNIKKYNEIEATPTQDVYEFQLKIKCTRIQYKLLKDFLESNGYLYN